MIDDGVSGFLVEPDNIKQMVDRIQKLIDTPQMRETMSHACVIKRDIYNCETIVEKWNTLIDLVTSL